MLSIDYREADRRVQLRWDEGDEGAQWLDVLRRLVFDQTEDPIQENGYCISTPWWSFAALRAQLFSIFKGYGLSLGQQVAVGAAAATLLRQSRRNAESYALATQAQSVLEADLRLRLHALGFVRELSPDQSRNVAKIAALPAAATFSVPGAGKTTEALATFFYRMTDGDTLLVIAPKNAFAAWDEQLADCVPSLACDFTRLTGGRERIAKLLDGNPRFAIISYQQLMRVADLVAAHCARYRVHVFLDESHRIKSGTGRQTARATLSLAHLPASKLVMSGTPMPQSVEDLIPQFTFLYPEIPASSETVIDLIRPIHVRTNKKQLGLPPVTQAIVPLAMAPMQHELYK